MHDRNVLSLVKGFAGSALLSLASLATGPAFAEGGNQGFTLLSMLSPAATLPAAGMDTCPDRPRSSRGPDRGAHR